MMEHMSRSEKIALLSRLGEYILGNGPGLSAVMERTCNNNPWFTPENQESALHAIAQHFLDPVLLEKWMASYPEAAIPIRKPKVALIMAGNLPLVGFHDWLCVFLAGLHAKMKLSDKDPFLLPHLLGMLSQWQPGVEQFWSFEERLSGFDAVIATGSNNSARYFEHYFGKYPHIIRKNRNAAAVLSGRETSDEIRSLGKDIFQYFGMGCRNVSKIYVPEGYDFNPLLETLHEFRDIILHHKYKHNYDYNYALYLLNKTPFKMNGCLLMVESEAIPSRIASLNYAFYKDPEDLVSELLRRREEIQCICSSTALQGLKVLPFGKAQEPDLWDYADGVDTMEFLQSLNG